MPEAIYNLILDDVATISAATLTGWQQATRDVLQVLPGEEQLLPLQIIMPMYQAKVEEAMNSQVCIAYQVGIALIWEGNRTFARDRTIIETIRNIRQALHRPTLPTATLATDPGGVWDGDIDLNPMFDTTQIPANCKFNLMKLTYKSWEARNG